MPYCLWQATIYFLAALSHFHLSPFRSYHFIFTSFAAQSRCWQCLFNFLFYTHLYDILIRHYGHQLLTDDGNLQSNKSHIVFKSIYKVAQLRAGNFNRNLTQYNCSQESKINLDLLGCSNHDSFAKILVKLFLIRLCRSHRIFFLFYEVCSNKTFLF